MSRPVQFGLAVLVTAALLSGSRARGQNEGQPDLDRATEAKLGAKSLDDLDEVVRLLETALKTGLNQENSQFAQNLLGSTLIQRGSMRANLFFKGNLSDPKYADDRKAALADLERGISLTPKQALASYTIARLQLLPGGDFQRAAEALDEAIELFAEEPRLQVKALLLRARIQKDADKRMADLNEAVRVAPNDVAALRTRSLFYAARKELKPALADLDKAIELAPEDMQTYELKALLLVRMKKHDEALATLEQAQEANPDSVAPLIQMARIHTAQEDPEAALADLDRAVSVDPKSVGVLLIRAAAHRELEQIDQALTDADKALELEPEHTTAMRIRAMLLADADRVPEAITQLEKLVKLDPEDLLALMQLGTFYHDQKRLDEAVNAYTTVLAEEPKSWLALRGRADVLLTAGKHREAIADYDEALKLKPKDPAILNNLAWVLATSPVDELRDGTRAVSLASDACRLTNHRLAHIVSTLAAAYAETGDFAIARKWADRAVKIGRDDQREALEKELESYRAEKPWREMLSEQPEEDK